MRIDHKPVDFYNMVTVCFSVYGLIFYFYFQLKGNVGSALVDINNNINAIYTFININIIYIILRHLQRVKNG